MPRTFFFHPLQSVHLKRGMVGQVDGLFSGFEKELPRNLDSAQVFGRLERKRRRFVVDRRMF